jgi:AcrR family transcriptional regulator
MAPLVSTTSSAKALVYTSPTIFERRRRILHEARHMISESGYDGFSIRELARRANVAQRTLYNAFGTRESIVISAIHQFFKDFHDLAQYTHPAHTLDGQLERIVKGSSRSRQLRPYITAVMAIFNSQRADRSVRQVIRKLSTDSFMEFATHLAASHELADQVTPKAFAEQVTRYIYATQSAWCDDEISDEDMIESIAETFLVTTGGSVRDTGLGKSVKEWLNQVRRRTVRWQKFRDAAAVPDGPRRAARRSAHRA